MPATKLDWVKSTNFSKPLQHKHLSTSDRFSAVYIVAPRAANPANPMNSFVDYAIKEYGVKRFVLIGDSSPKPGGLHVEKVCQRFLHRGVEHAMLRPTWSIGTNHDLAFA